MKAKSYLIVFIIVLFTSPLFSQSNVISGKVLFIDKGVKGVSVEIPLSNKKVFTDNAGNFNIGVSTMPVKANVKYKRIEKEVLLSSKSSIEIILVPKEKKFFRMINYNPDLYKCELFLKEYPDGVYTPKVVELKEEIIFVEAYDYAVETFNVEKLEAYLLKYPEGKYISKAKKMIEITLWQLACKENTIESYKRYLIKYPNGIAAKLAKQKLAKLNN